MFVDSDCKFCHYRPCSVDAAICPRCGHAAPNPSIRSRVNIFVNAIISALSLLFIGGIGAVMAYAIQPIAGIVVVAVLLLWSAWEVAHALWYACDPTMSIFPARQA
jgi:hypothetical protein